jgi:putative tricarboxylic transport membrane protein
MLVVQKNAGFWAAIVVFLFGSVFFFQSLTYEYYGAMGPGPGLLPLWLSGILMVLSVLYVIESLRHVVSWQDILPDRSGLISICRILGAFLLFMFTIEILGFIVSATLFLLILLAKEYKWYVSVAISIGISLVLFWVFGEMLSIPLPVIEFGW